MNDVTRIPRRCWLRTSHGGAERDYTITYLDDTPERNEAAAFFNSMGADEKNMYRRLLPDIELPHEVTAMSVEAAQAYLDSHPMRERWRLLKIHHQDMVFDDDLARLQYLPELTDVHVISSRITNTGLRHLRYLSNLKCLVIYSRKVSNACLKDIACLKSLEMLDLQMCPWISHWAFSSACRELPMLRETFPPLRKPLTAIIRWFYTEWRIQRKALRTNQRRVTPAALSASQ